MSICVIVCADCGREVCTTDRVMRTPRGRIVCKQCALENYTDLGLIGGIY